MTDKKDKQHDQKENSAKSTSDNVNTTDKSNKNVVESEEEKELKDELKEEVKEKKIELIEEKAGAGLQLEYFSKDDLIQKINDVEKLIKENENKIKELNGWKDKYVRLQAEFDNTQKRWEKNRQYLKGQYTAETLRYFLPLYDSFIKALESSKENNQLVQFYNQFMSILKFQGAEPIKTQINDVFDYNIHEAIASVEKEDFPENRIIDIIQDGWKFNKDVLRYTKVVISKKPKPPEIESEKELKMDAEVESNKEKQEQEHKSLPESEKKNENGDKIDDKSQKGDKNSSESDKNEYVT